MIISVTIGATKIVTKRLTLTLLTWTIWRAPTNDSKWRMGSNSAFKGSKKNLDGITGRHSINSLQKTAILGTSHIIGKVLQSET